MSILNRLLEGEDEAEPSPIKVKFDMSVEGVAQFQKEFDLLFEVQKKGYKSELVSFEYKKLRFHPGEVISAEEWQAYGMLPDFTVVRTTNGQYTKVNMGKNKNKWTKDGIHYCFFAVLIHAYGYIEVVR